jgi:DNA (cytosine-5)-methyltransferase 1
MRWLSLLNEMGYTTFLKVLNAKDYGVPQNRKRVFAVSILDGATYQFPTPFKLDRRLKDVLEADVDESFFISDDIVQRVIDKCETLPVTDESKVNIHPSCAHEFINKDAKIKQLFNLVPNREGRFANSHRGRVYAIDGIAPCCNCCAGGNLEPKILLTDSVAPMVKETANTLQRIAQSARRCEVGVTVKSDNSLRPFNAETKAKNGISELCTDYDGSVGSTIVAARPNNVYGVTTRYRIRKLTPREQYRLMDVSEQNINRLLNSGISKTQHYKLAGNSIVVSCLYHVLRELLVDTQ